MTKNLYLLLLATLFSALGAQSQTLSVSLKPVGVPSEHTIHLEATSTGTTATKGFQFRKMGTTAWTMTGYIAPFSADISNLSNGKWEYRAFVVGTTGDSLYSQTQNIQLALCCEASTAITYPPTVPIDSSIVDKGVIIGGIKWATRNVDMPNTFVVTPQDAGMLYQWNRNVGWSSSGALISSNNSSVWDSSTPTGNEWETTNDVCPEGWRIPTASELQVLLSINNSWISSPTSGYLFVDGSNSMFLPTPGYRAYYDGTLLNINTDANYWSNAGYDGYNNFYAYALYTNNSTIGWHFISRGDAFTIRCVAK